MKFTDGETLGHPPLTMLELRALLLLLERMRTVQELRTALGLDLDAMNTVLDALVAFDLIVRFTDPEAASR